VAGRVRTENRQRRRIRNAARVGGELCRVAAAAARLRAGSGRFGHLCWRGRSLEPAAEGGVLELEPAGCALPFQQLPRESVRSSPACSRRVRTLRKGSLQDSNVLQEGGGVCTAVHQRNPGLIDGPIARAGHIGQRRRQDWRHKSARKQGCESCPPNHGRAADMQICFGQPDRPQIFRRRSSITKAADPHHHDLFATCLYAMLAGQRLLLKLPAS
jgi:hypothetical protein